MDNVMFRGETSSLDQFVCFNGVILQFTEIQGHTKFLWPTMYIVYLDATRVTQCYYMCCVATENSLNQDHQMDQPIKDAICKGSMKKAAL